MSLCHALLGLLDAGPASGYDLLKRFDGSLAFVWQATQSQLYTELGKLDANGLVEVTSVGPRGRKEYAITDEGRAELRRWLTETEPERTRRNEATMRVFFLGSIEPAQARAYLERQADLAGAELARLEQVRDTTDWDHGPGWIANGRVALEQGLRVTAAYVEWARWAADQFGDPDRAADAGASPARDGAVGDAS